jgi:threonine/homoserine/homoserine lactone efflux protein
MTVGWLIAYAVVIARVGDYLRRSRIRRLLDAATGSLMVGLGLRLATTER